MCAFQEPPRADAKQRSTDSILSRNRHGHHALKKFHDHQFGIDGQGTGGGSGGHRSTSGSSTPTRAATLDFPSVLSRSNNPSRTGTPDSGRSTAGKSRTNGVAKKHRTKRLENGNRSLKFASQAAHHSVDEYDRPVLSDHSPRASRSAKQRRGSWDIGSPVFYQNRHFLSRDNKSLQNLSSLDRLVDDRTGYQEDKRASDDFLNELSKRKNGSELRAYYERLNETLDTWREVDEILDSRFPEEVMLRFGSVEEVDRFNGNRKRLPWMDLSVEESDTGESGYQEESEESDGDTEAIRRRHRQSSLARAASAISTFWFGGGGQTPKQSRSRSSTFLQDEEAALLSSDAATTRAQERNSGKRYGATHPFASAGSALSTIEDDPNSKPNSHDQENSSNTPVSRSGVEQSSQESSAAVVRTTSPSGNNPTAVENGVLAKKLEATAESANGSVSASRSRRYRRRSREDSGTESDDEESQSQSEPVMAGKLDAKLAAEREERQSRTKHREVVVPGTNGEATVVKDRSQSSGKSPGAEQQLRKPGGMSERERMRLLQHVPGRQEREGERERDAQFAININLAINVLLLAGKVIAVFSSNSVSLIASLVDSALDLLSTVIIFGTSKAISYRSFHTYFKYPVGKKRFEPLGVVIFAVLMIASFCQVLVESVERLASVVRTGSEEPGEASELPFIGIAFMVLTIVIKTFMWLIYRKSPSSGVRAVAQDAENDVVFNVASLIFPVIGSKLAWPALDPIGGICLSIYIIVEWIETLMETVTKLSGAVGSAQDISRALYLVTRFRSVNSVSALEVYHAGDDMIVEADIVLPHGLALKEAHDLGEIITYCTENLTQVERAYIHLDYNPVGQAGHIATRG